MLVVGAAEEYLIDYDQLATAILNKLTSKTFVLDQGTKTLIAAINSNTTLIEDKSDESESTVGFVAKNLVPYPFDSTTRTHFGITWTDNLDGTITANGTCNATGSEYSVFNIHMRADTKTPFKLKKGKYILNGTPSGGSSSKWQTSIGCTNPSDGTSYVNIGVDYGSGLTFELDRDIDTIQVQLTIRPGIVADNMVFRPMIRPATISDATFEKYIPPVKDQLDDLYDKTEPNMLTDAYLREHLDCTAATTFEYSDGEVTVTVLNPGNNVATYAEIELEPNTVYSFSFKSNRDGNVGGGGAAQGRDASGIVTLEDNSSSPNTPIVFNTGDYTTIRLVFWIGGTSVTGDLQAGYSARFWDIMLVKGAVPSPYLTGAKDIGANMAEINERTAVNLWEHSGYAVTRSSQQVSGNSLTVTATNVTATGNAYAYKRMVLEENTDYTLFFKSSRTGSYGGGCLVYAVSGGSAISNLSNNLNDLNPIVTFNTGSGFDTIQFNFVATASGNSGGQNGDQATFSDIMLVKGRFAPNKFVPYIGGFDTLAEAIADLQEQVAALS